ncbi:glycosyltransferase family 2 protein [Mycoplasma todarodis]|uniref:glycosyltransferase family 2 protein n=1 Tax=Mycoplasma todarodis TaxID=1937191 RepID=UPI003B3635F6
MYKFSLIIPAYNIEEFSKRFFDSMKNISDDVEVIFVNDKSTDNSEALINKFVKDKINMRLINHKKNKGLGGALNTGIDNMSTKWYFHVDPDDVITKDFAIEIKKKIASNSNAMLIRYKFMYRT